MHCNPQRSNAQIYLPMRQCLYIFLTFAVSLLSNNIFAAEKDIVINEVMPANVSYIFDHSYNYGAWVELFNASEETIDLAGYSFTDEANSPSKFVFPQNMGKIAPHEYKIIF